MIGIQELIEVKKDFIPEIVEVYVGDDSDQYFAKEWHKYTETIDHPSIVIEDKDNLHNIDWRFGFNSTVFIRGNDTARMIDVYNHVTKWGAERVFIFHNDGNQTEIIDSKGLLSGIIE